MPLSAIKSVSTVTDLTPEQFQFVRAIYVATRRFREHFFPAIVQSGQERTRPSSLGWGRHYY